MTTTFNEKITDSNDTNNTKWMLKKCEEVITSLPEVVNTSTTSEDPDLQSPEANLAIQVFISETPALLLTLLINNPSPNKNLKGGIQKFSKQYCTKVIDLLSSHSLLHPSTLSNLLRSLSSHTKDTFKVCTESSSSSSPPPPPKKSKNMVEASIIWNEYPILRKKLATTLIEIWKNGNEEERILSLLVIKIHSSKWTSIHDICAKDMYNVYLEITKKLSSHTLSQASLLLRGLVEIFSLNLNYLSPSITSLSLRFLKRLAHTLQNSIRSGSGHSSLSSIDKKKTGHNRTIQTSSIGDLLSWSFVSAIRFWSKLLEKISSISSNKTPSPLMGPFCGILCGSLSFQGNNPRYFPFHIHCVMAALDLSNDGIKIPGMWECLLRIISQISRLPLYRLGVDSKNKALPGSAAGSFDLPSMIKVTKTDSTSLAYLESVLDEVMYLVFVQLSKEDIIILPEVIEPIISLLKKLSIGDRKIKQQIEGHLSLCVSAQKKCIKDRVKVSSSSSVSPSLYLSKSQQNRKTCDIIEKYIVSLDHVRQMRKEAFPEVDVDGSVSGSSSSEDEDEQEEGLEVGEEMDFTDDDLSGDDENINDDDNDDDDLSDKEEDSSSNVEEEDILLEEDDEEDNFDDN